MDYSFNGDVAAIYGIDEAVFIHNLYWWIRKNEANGRHHYEGRNWTYNSMKAFSELFPFWTTKQVRRIIEKLKNAGALLVGNFNDTSFDRTQWYALSDEVIEIYEGKKVAEKEPDHLPKRAVPIRPNGQMTFAQMGKPIPDSKPYSKPDNLSCAKAQSELFEQFWDAYPKKKAKGDAEQAFKAIAADETLVNEILVAIQQQKKSNQWKEQGGRFVPYPATWLRGRQWEDEMTPEENMRYIGGQAVVDRQEPSGNNILQRRPLRLKREA